MFGSVESLRQPISWHLFCRHIINYDVTILMQSLDEMVTYINVFYAWVITKTFHQFLCILVVLKELHLLESLPNLAKKSRLI